MRRFFHDIHLPEQTQALLWDMDGVLIDSLGLDQEICAPLFSQHLGAPIQFSDNFIKSLFALDPKSFIEALMQDAMKQAAITDSGQKTQDVLTDYLHQRHTNAFPILPGVTEALKQAKALGLKQAIVSNNPTEAIHKILAQSGVEPLFDLIVGNDIRVNGAVLRKKPAPDFYLYAIKMLGVVPDSTVVFEDSAMGCQAGLAAGSHVIGLLTGSADLQELQMLRPSPHQIFSNLRQRIAV